MIAIFARAAGKATRPALKAARPTIKSIKASRSFKNFYHTLPFKRPKRHPKGLGDYVKKAAFGILDIVVLALSFIASLFTVEPPKKPR